MFEAFIDRDELAEAYAQSHTEPFVAGLERGLEYDSKMPRDYWGPGEERRIDVEPPVDHFLSNTDYTGHERLAYALGACVAIDDAYAKRSSWTSKKEGART